MGSYREIKGDLLDLFDKGEFNVIAHGANCYSEMGAGIALQIKNKYSEVYYKDIYSSLYPLEKYGSYTYVGVSIVPRKYIFNLYTQLKPGPNADITAIRMSLKKLNLFYQGFSPKKKS